MAKIWLCEAAHCEHAGAYGYENNHTQGNSTGDELRKILYYSCIGYNPQTPWTNVFRSTDKNVANAMAIRMRQACENMNIGYGQATRTGFHVQMFGAAHYDPSKITVLCDCDCSSLVNTVAKVSWLAIGHNIPLTGLETTAQMPTKYNAPAMKPFFTDVTKSVNLATGAGLQAGDILVRPSTIGAGHTAIVWQIEEEAKARTGHTTTDLYLRKGAGTLYGAIAVMKKGSAVTILEEAKTITGALWYKVSYNNQVGYCSSKYIA